MGGREKGSERGREGEREGWREEGEGYDGEHPTRLVSSFRTQTISTIFRKPLTCSAALQWISMAALGR